MTELLYMLIAMAKGIASWFVPFAVAAYVVTYFVMAIVFVAFWKQEQGPWLRPLWRKIGQRGDDKK